MKEVIIVGAGLSGLSAAYFLNKAGIKPLILEARNRWGGRVLTVPAGGKATPLEMGATWFTDKHTHLISLLKELKLSYFTQYQTGVGVFETSFTEKAQLFQVPANVEPSYRIAGGTSRLLDTLIEHIGRDQLVMGAPLESVSEQPSHIEISSSQGKRFTCSNLVLTVPPKLIVSQKIAFNPALPSALVPVMEATHTWMGEAIKFAVEYKSPFWRQQGYAGVAFSHVGIVQELHDHTNFEETHFALKGFLSAEAYALSKQERETAVIEQLTRLLGKGAASYLSYTEKLWKQEAYTFASYTNQPMPHQHSGHPLYARPLMDGRLYLSGSETSPYYGGYLEGAVYSGMAAARAILKKRNTSA